MDYRYLLTWIMAVVATISAAPAPPSEPVIIVNATGGGLQIPDNVAVNLPKASGNDVVNAVVDLIAHSGIFPEDYLFLRRLASMETGDGTDTRTYNILGYYGGIWQVDNDMFRETQNMTSALSAKFSQIREAFGIDWPSVQWRDLQKPLYSGLAASLYLFLKGNIPVNTEEQGTYWQNKYHQTASPYNYTRAAKTSSSDCAGNEQVDLAFLLDSTTSADDFQRTTIFVRGVVDRFSLGSNAIRVAVFRYGQGGVSPSIGYNTYQTKIQILSAINSLNQLSSGGTNSVDSATAIRTVMANIFSTINTAQRPNAAKMIILVTNDASPSDLSLFKAVGSEALLYGVTVFSVGIGGAVGKELDDVSTPPAFTHSLKVKDYRDLNDIVPIIQRRICREPMIGTGVVSCQSFQCRNVAFPVTSTVMTVITKSNCSDGRTDITTRSPTPSSDFNDAVAVVEVNQTSFVDVWSERELTAQDPVGFIYAQFFPYHYADCLVTINVTQGPHVTEEQCPATDVWRFPTNPCSTANQKAGKTRFPDPYDPLVYIECDLANQMYLTHCPPGMFYKEDCMQCVGADVSVITGCTQSVISSPFCGLPNNPCTTEMLLQNKFFFACPQNETMYLQCDTWGKSYVRSCQEHYVWRQGALTCEYLPSYANPCRQGVDLAPFPDDPHKYIQCDAQQIPYTMSCNPGLVWNQAMRSCDWPHFSAVPVTHLPVTVLVPLAQTTVNVDSSMIDKIISTGFQEPCTEDNTRQGERFFPYKPNSHYYIQCDLSGDAFLKSCLAFYYNPASHTCVPGPVGGIVGRK